MPIISPEQMRGLLFVVLFFCLGYTIQLLLQFGQSTGALSLMPRNLMQPDVVEIELSGAVSLSGRRMVASKLLLWQVLIHDNSWQSYIDWTKVNMTQSLYDGLEYKAPFRKLRAGESIQSSDLIKSKGDLLQTIPCLPHGMGDTQREKLYTSILKNTNVGRKDFDACLSQFISGLQYQSDR